LKTTRQRGSPPHGHQGGPELTSSTQPHPSRNKGQIRVSIRRDEDPWQHPAAERLVQLLETLA
jgi:hypothetical protein